MDQLNKDFNSIGQEFIKFFYQLFDQPSTRLNAVQAFVSLCYFLGFSLHICFLIHFIHSFSFFISFLFILFYFILFYKKILNN